MTDVIVEVGPATIRGPNDARPEWVSAAVDCIDDELALLADRPVPARDVWREVMSAVAGVGIHTIVLVCPTWWSSSRICIARTAAGSVATTVVVLQRTSLLRERISGRRTTIVEIAPEFVIVTHPGVRAAVIPRRDGPADDAGAVVAAVGASAAVLVDAPVGVEGAEPLASAIAGHMRATGIAVTFTDENSVRVAAATLREREKGESIGAAATRRVDRDRRGAAVLAGALAAVMLCGGFAVRVHTSDSRADDMPMTLLVEGRVGLTVPAAWTAQRITTGPGSARVQIVSPSDGDVVLHVTQSTGMRRPSLATTAQSLRAALDAEPDGIFVDFNPSDHRAGKAAVTYRELRADHHVAWAVVIDDMVRIAIGCQSAPGHEHLVRKACDLAIGSAHAVV